MTTVNSSLASRRNYPFALVEWLRQTGEEFHVGEVAGCIYPGMRQSDKRRARALRVLMEFVAAGLLELCDTSTQFYRKRHDPGYEVEVGQLPLRARVLAKIESGQHAPRMSRDTVLGLLKSRTATASLQR